MVAMRLVLGALIANTRNPSVILWHNKSKGLLAQYQISSDTQFPYTDKPTGVKDKLPAITIPCRRQSLDIQTSSMGLRAIITGIASSSLLRTVDCH